MSILHITWGPTEWTPWKTPHENWGEIVHPDCCLRRMAREEVEVSWGTDPFPSYYEPVDKTRCKPGFGCDADPRRRVGKAGRYWMVRGA
jgi:hypothetical protein